MQFYHREKLFKLRNGSGSRRFPSFAKEGTGPADKRVS